MKSMVNFSFIFMLVLIGFIACKDDDPLVNDELSCSADSIAFKAEQDAKLVLITTNDDWSVVTTESWVSVSSANGKGETAIVIGVAANQGKKRETNIRVKTAKKEELIWIAQAAVPVLNYSVSGVKFTLRLVESGSFLMGDDKINTPSHTVQLNDFYIAETEVTNELWKTVTGTLPYDAFPSYSGHTEHANPDWPVTAVSWVDVMTVFLPSLKTKTGVDFRLPTEAEWEFAALGGTKSMGYRFAGSDQLVEVGWNLEFSGGVKQDVMEKKPNELGLYDMSGNAAEWCSDWYEKNYSFSGVLVNPKGPSTGTYRVVRGGDYQSQPGFFDSNECSVKQRNNAPPEGGNYDRIGVRLVVSL